MIEEKLKNNEDFFTSIFVDEKKYKIDVEDGEVIVSVFVPETDARGRWTCEREIIITSPWDDDDIREFEEFPWPTLGKEGKR